MDNSSLNASHRYARQAHHAFQKHRFDEAIHCHEQARKKIDEAIEQVSDRRNRADWDNSNHTVLPVLFLSLLSIKYINFKYIG